MSPIELTKTETTKGGKKHVKRVITPAGKTVLSSLDRRMTVDKDIVDELLLVCGVIGTTTDGENELVPVTDCLNWLQDLQRALRRDEDLYRPISLLIGKWKVVEQKLLPLVLTCRYDTPMILTVVKILVILTKPLAQETRRAGRLVIDAKKNSKDVVQQQLKLRENALAQADLLLEYKRIFCHHPSHQAGQANGLLSVFVSLLAEPLSKTGTSRTDTDHLTIELVLHLFRNLLAAEPLLNASSEATQENNQTHHSLIALFGKEMVLEIILVLGQELDTRENAQYNLLMMELLNLLFKSQDPTAVARCKNRGGICQQKKATSSLLRKRLKQEQSRSRNIAGNRHGHFGGTWVHEQQGGRRHYMGAATTHWKGVGTVAKRKNKRAEPFIGPSSSRLVYSRRTPVHDGPATQRAHNILHAFCERFVNDCYGPVMKSLKNEFRRDSARLEDDDKVIFFRIVWFFKQWWRSSDNRTCLGQLIFTMDVFCFTLVLNATDHFYHHKEYGRLTQTVALYSELLHMLHLMQTSTDETENIMALGLMDRLFYNGEPLDRLPKLLSRWAPSTTSREYVCDLAEICHMSLKLLDFQGKTCKQDTEYNDLKQAHDRVAKIRALALDFDVNGYFCKKIVSNQLIWMYTQLLGQYKINAPLVHHRVVSMFIRMSKTEVALPRANDADTPINPLGMKRVTLEPMLYTLPLILVLDCVLNDTSVRADKSNNALLSFATNLLHNFWKVSHDNPLLYVECIFRHAAPHRFCDLATNLYVTEELRMIAERELLLEEQRRFISLQEDTDRELEDSGELELDFQGGSAESSRGHDLGEGCEINSDRDSREQALLQELQNGGVTDHDQSEVIGKRGIGSPLDSTSANSSDVEDCGGCDHSKQAVRLAQSEEQPAKRRCMVWNKAETSSKSQALASRGLDGMP